MILSVPVGLWPTNPPCVPSPETDESIVTLLQQFVMLLVPPSVWATIPAANLCFAVMVPAVRRFLMVPPLRCAKGAALLAVEV